MKRNSRLLIFFVLLVVAYALISLGAPPNPEALDRYDITATQARLLNLSFVVPLIATWAVAYYGYIHFRDYARRVRSTREGPAFDEIETGAMILVFTLPVQGIINAATNNFIVNHPGSQPSLTILRNYIYMLLFVSAFIIIARGCARLLLTLKKIPHKRQPAWLTLVIVLLSSAYIALIINKDVTTEDNNYFLPIWLIITTIAVPYLFAWSRMIQALYDLYLYLTLVKGSIYKAALRAVVIGIGAVTVLNILIQLLAVTATKLTRLDLTPIIIIIYLLVFCYAIGFGLMARGSQKLTKIEEA